jgi:hypothetical protein
MSRNYTGPWNCPVCGIKLDNQGSTDTSTSTQQRQRVDLYCHRCVCHFIFAIRYPKLTRPVYDTPAASVALDPINTGTTNKDPQ